METAGGTATVNGDYRPVSLRVRWADGDSLPRLVEIPLIADADVEPEEIVELRLADAACGSLGGVDSSTLTIVSEDTEEIPVYSVGGTVSGLSGTGLVIREGLNEIAITANGVFAFPADLLDGWEYDVRVKTQPVNPRQVCTVTNGKGTIAGADVTNVFVSCVDAAIPGALDTTFGNGGVVTDPVLVRGAEELAILPDGGIVVTYTDITPAVQAAEALERANETLERRVRERTEELTRLNRELGRAKAVADEANISKTRFLAAASHDILQPLNAARLYATSLVERERASDKSRLAVNVDASLEAVEEILAALLDISRLDTGSLQPEYSAVRIDEILSQLEVEFAPIAQEKGLKLTFVPSSVTVRTDRRLLRRLLQNLVANAIKYTPKGRVLVGCRRLGNGRLRVETTVRATDRTGVEMEALTAAAVAALSLYDTAKAFDRAARIDRLRLLSKTGGKSGDFVRS